MITFQGFFPLREKQQAFVSGLLLQWEQWQFSCNSFFISCSLRQGKGETVVINKLVATSSKPVFCSGKHQKCFRLHPLAHLKALFSSQPLGQKLIAALFSFSKVGLGLHFIMPFMNQQSPGLTLLHSQSGGKKYYLTVIGGGGMCVI